MFKNTSPDFRYNPYNLLALDWYEVSFSLREFHDRGCFAMSPSSRSMWILTLFLATGCAHHPWCLQDKLAKRIQPPPGFHESLVIDTPPPTDGKSEGEKKPEAPEHLPDPTESPKNEEADDSPEFSVSSRPASCEASDEGCPGDRTVCQQLALPEAIALAFRFQPRLRVFLESIEQARGGEQIAFAPFLPMAVAGYSVGGFDLNAGGKSVPLGPLPGFTFIPALGSIPLGLDIHTGYEFAELKLQWLICDFGRRLGRFRQAVLAVDIAQLQSDRAFQTVANEVSVAYYQVLRTQALRKTAQDAVRRAEDDLDVAKKLEKGGALEKEKRLRIEVQLAESQRLLDAAGGAEAVAVAALNLAIGLNVNAPTGVVETSDVPPFMQSLAECLQTAVGLRREFQVARASVQVADEGRQVAKADFAPRIVADGSLFDFQQSAPRGHADLAVGFIKLEWGLFEGGKRVAEVRSEERRVGKEWRGGW